MANQDWTREELVVAVDAFRAMRATGGAVSATCEALVAGPLSGRSVNAVRRRLTHVRMVLEATERGGGPDDVAVVTNVGRGVAGAIAEALGRPG
jgi:hypothetical protein